MNREEYDVLLVSCLAYSATLKMDAISSSEASASDLHGVTTQETITSDTHCRKILKFSEIN
jgi:transcriptional antiterminator Rof (Rho-off)